MKRKLFSAAVSLLCAMALLLPAYAAGSEAEVAGEFLREKGILQGNASGDLMLDKGLNRIELAAILTRLLGNPEHIAADKGYYTRQCTFTDVPEWARTNVGFCAANVYMIGYNDETFGAYDDVTPAMACTVTLRYLEYPETDWDYNTAAAKADAVGLIPDTGLTDGGVTRGEMAVLLYRAFGNHYTGGDTQEPQATDALSRNADGSINIPDGDAKLTLKEGDVIRCDDGTNYTITDMSRYDANAFASGPVGPLPTPTCDWSSFPEVELPPVEVRRFNDEYGDRMFIRNLYETRRMQYTIMNLAGNNPETSENGKLRYGPNGTPAVRISLSIPDDVEPQFFWPWRESQLSDDFNSVPKGEYNMEVWDVYGNGIFMYTEYLIDR